MHPATRLSSLVPGTLCSQPRVHQLASASGCIMTKMTRIPTPWGLWEPATAAEVAGLFSGCGAPWWIAGGYAIELAAGRPLREHGDIDVLLLRRDQFVVQRALSSWQWHAADPPGTLRPWQPDKVLSHCVHDIWCRPGPDQPWKIQVMLDESSGDDWISRRDKRIRRPIGSLGSVTADGIPYLSPEIQLLYKAKAPRPKDETDFTAALPILTVPQREWLADALSLAYGPEHPWRACLTAEPGQYDRRLPR
jgi:hypothetical protein